MGYIYFNTANPYITGVIGCSHTRTATGYTANCDIYMYRNNSWTGTETHGTIKYQIYCANGWSGERSKAFRIKNGGAWCYLDSFSKTVSLDALSGGSYDVGFSSSGPVTGLNTTSFTKKGEDVGAYASRNGAPSISIEDTLGNSFRIKTTTGGSGNNNSATNCHIYYTLDGSTPSSSNSNGFRNTNKSANQSYSVDISMGSPSTVKARAYTIGTYPANDGIASGVASTNVKVYTSPKNQPIPTIKIYKDVNYTKESNKLTPKSYIKFEWSKAEPGNSNSPVSGCRVYPYVFKSNLNQWFSYINGSLVATDNYFDVWYDSKSSYSYLIDAKSLSLVKGDKICIGIQAWHHHKTIDNVNWWSLAPVITESDQITVESAGVMGVKISDNVWKEGQAYIKIDDSTWKEANSVYIKTSPDTWKESV